MGNTYTKIHIHIIIVLKYRAGLISNEWKEELYKYIAGIIKNQKHKLIIINGVPDHLYILVGLKPHQSLAELVQDIKASSSRWINEKKFLKVNFAWQVGYAAISYSQSHLDKVIEYIRNQEKHHKKKSFFEEYLQFLKAFKVEYDERYLLKEPM